MRMFGAPAPSIARGDRETVLEVLPQRLADGGAQGRDDLRAQGFGLDGLEAAGGRFHRVSGLIVIVIDNTV